MSQGMLEQSSLLLRGWTRANAAEPWQRPITDAAGQPLGYVRRVVPAHGSWFSWLARARLEVFETEDASHLMTLVRAWSFAPSWNVYDADSLFVGIVHARWIVASDGSHLAEPQHLSNTSGQILDGTGTVLTSYQVQGDSHVEIRFTAAAMANPFLRMLLLSCILTLT